jgi:hypothetical protein
MSFEVFYKTLSSADATNKFISLDGTSVGTNNVALDLIGGTAQAITNDFAVGPDGTSIRWDSPSYNLYGQMATGDQVRVIFDRS